MKSIRTVIISLLSLILLFVFSSFEVYADIIYETQIFKGSNESKIRKLQEIFKGLDLYFGEISGKFEDIEKDFINYQITRGIVLSVNDEGAGYFGQKTMNALENEFGEKYLQLKEIFLRADEPSIEERYFQITAYYTPLPNQKKYQKGSYSADVKLNGDNKTANGREVFAGLIAAPKNYPFGTKIYLEGLGIGEVADRGGAIVNAGERGHELDRLDIWVGYGDEGLTRALTWGRRNVKGFIVDDSYEVNIEFDESPIAKYTNLKIDPENLNEDNVISLQRLFKEIGFYNGEEDGIWDNIKDIFINFQIENGIISSINDIQAGYFGPKTYSYLQEKYGKSSGLFVEKYFEAKEKIKEISQSDNFSTLTTIQVQNMNAVKGGLEKILEKKYGLNIIKISSFKTKLKSALTQIANSSKYLNKKDEFLYLAEIL